MKTSLVGWQIMIVLSSTMAWGMAGWMLLVTLAIRLCARWTLSTMRDNIISNKLIHTPQSLGNFLLYSTGARKGTVRVAGLCRECLVGKVYKNY